MIDKEKVANEADVIINGYAISACNEGLRIVNLNSDGHSAVITRDGGLIETNMDDIELAIATDYALESCKYMEDQEYA